ncbi:MAG: methyltransferase domain-containing protein [Nanoarchaeota archaeon]|nr:methyltransferase domain-containing protein [Nanoarchaeota archaeon]
MFVRPDKIIESLNVGPSMAVADFGCGSGHYVIQAAKKVGKSGKVYGIDIQKEMLSYVRAQANLEGLTNIETIWTDLETPDATRLRNDSVDLVIISNILFQAEDKNAVIREAQRILKSGGRVVVIEWDIENLPDKFGPAMDSRIPSKSAKDIFERAGFAFEKEFNPGDHHYGLIFRKQ